MSKLIIIIPLITTIIAIIQTIDNMRSSNDIKSVKVEILKKDRLLNELSHVLTKYLDYRVNIDNPTRLAPLVKQLKKINKN